MQKRLFYITSADFIVRTGYQMGKSPLLPVFAAALGAGGAFLGLIVAVSTLTGLALKPLIGALSDRWGRGFWLWGGALLFAGVPFLYQLIQGAEQLLALRLVHGLATAIYGPVTLAFVAEHADGKGAAQLGWFGVGRSGGYIVGPAAAGWLLTVMDPVAVFTIIGLFSCVAFLPLALLGRAALPRPRTLPGALSLTAQLRLSLRSGTRSAAVWLAGGLEGGVFIGLYAVKAFLPLHALAHGVGIGLVGTFFSVQEVTHLLARPLLGRVGDHLGYQRAIALGMLGIAAAFSLLPFGLDALFLLALAALLGAAQALVFPSTIALVAARIDSRHAGAGMGVVGALKNTGKVIGPVLGGLLVQGPGFNGMVRVMAVLLAAAAVAVWLAGISGRGARGPGRRDRAGARAPAARG